MAEEASNEALWRAMLTGEIAALRRRDRQRPRRIPGSPRCKGYSVSNRVIIDSDGFVDRLVADEVVSFYLPFLGPEHPGVAVRAARDLLLAAPEVERGRKLPVGAGVHTGTAFVGSVGFEDSDGDQEKVRDFTALGDAVNVAARLASLAGAGEALISEAVFASGADLGEFTDLERRRLEVRGRSEPIEVRVLRVGVASEAAAG